MNGDAISDDSQISAAEPICDQDKVMLSINTKDLVECTLFSSTHLGSNFIIYHWGGTSSLISLATHHIGSTPSCGT